MTVFFRVVLAILLSLAFGPVLCDELREEPLFKSRTPSATMVRKSAGCPTEAPAIASAIQQLSLGEYTSVAQARKKLLSYAEQAPACRREVVRALMARMDKPDLNFETQPSNYYLWREGSQLLGELRATEALDLLISHLDLSSGFHSASMGFQPAVLGVRRMGEAAIPKLTVALLQDPKVAMRMAAVNCLTDIGGVAAMNALLQAKQRETNNCVANFIAASLRTFSYKSKSGRVLFDTAAPQANIATRRSWLAASECVD